MLIYSSTRAKFLILLHVLIAGLLVAAGPLDKSDLLVDPGTIAAREPDYSQFIECMQDQVEDYPNGDEPTSVQVDLCMNQLDVVGQRRRSAEGTEYRNDVILEVRANPPTGELLESVYAAGADLALGTNVICDSKEVPNKFLWTPDIISSAGDACSQIMQDIQENGQRRNGTVATRTLQYTSGHNKRGHQITDGENIAAMYSMTFVPPSEADTNGIKEYADALGQLCPSAITKLATKGSGCTAEVNYFRPSKAKSFTGTGAIGGSIDIVWNRTSLQAGLTIGNLELVFLES